MSFIKRLFCKHEYEFERNIYGDEINHVGGCRSWWRCRKCGKRVLDKSLHWPEPIEMTIGADGSEIHVGDLVERTDPPHRPGVVTHISMYDDGTIGVHVDEAANFHANYSPSLLRRC